jgi:hypothetical protein
VNLTAGPPAERLRPGITGWPRLAFIAFSQEGRSMCCSLEHWSPRAAALALFAFAVTGCGSGSVTGQVKVNGVPLSGGWVTLKYKDGKHSPTSGPIGTDGSYRISGCPAGEVRITVRQPQGRGKKPGQPKQATVPPRYADPEKSDLKVTIQGGRQRIDLELKP